MTVVEPVITLAPTRPMEILPNLGQVARRHTTICSIYPAALRKTVMHNGRTPYEIAAAPRESYSLLRVFDTQQWCQRPDPTEGKHAMLPMPIPARIVAEDLVATWAGDTLGKRSGHSPGIGIIAGDTPTPEELKSLRDSQNALFNWYINDAMGKHLKGNGNEITDIHRLAAKEMLDKGAEQLPWYPVVDFAAVKSCIACGKQINQNALRCEHCTTMLPQFYMDFGIDPVGDATVSEFIARIKANKAAVEGVQSAQNRPIDPPIKQTK